MLRLLNLAVCMIRVWYQFERGLIERQESRIPASGPSFIPTYPSF